MIYKENRDNHISHQPSFFLKPILFHSIHSNLSNYTQNYFYKTIHFPFHFLNLSTIILSYFSINSYSNHPLSFSTLDTQNDRIFRIAIWRAWWDVLFVHIFYSFYSILINLYIRKTLRLVRTDSVFNQYFVLIFLQTISSSFIIQYTKYKANLMK